MIFSVIFQGGVLLDTKGNIEEQSMAIVRNGQGASLILEPDTEYNFTPFERQAFESVTVRSFVNGGGVYHRATNNEVVHIRLPEDEPIILITHKVQEHLLLVAKIWHIDLITFLTESEKRRRGLPECLILGVN